MSASFAPTAAPANAVRMWMDDKYIYAELPGSTTCILSFSITEGGLSKALNILRQRRTDFAGEPVLKLHQPHTSPEGYATAQRLLKARTA